jgi:5'-nucleotidase
MDLVRHERARGRFGKPLVVASLIIGLVAAVPAAGTADTPTGHRDRDKVDVWLTLLHNNDGESALLETLVTLEDGSVEPFGGVAPFATVMKQLRREAWKANRQHPGGAKHIPIVVSSGDNYLASAAFQASLDKGVPYYDGIALDLIGYNALAIGNHEFDFGPDVFAGFVSSFAPGPGRQRDRFVSANLDFSNEPNVQALVDAGRIVDSLVIKMKRERIGIVGATTEALPTISSPRDVIVNAVLPAVQAEVDSLEARGVDKIILISHLQSILEDMELASMLDGVDVMVAGGGDELLANDGDLLVPGDEASVFGSYPLTALDADGTEVPIVTTSGGYRYVGELKVAFDKWGNVLEVAADSGPVRVTTGDFDDAVKANRRVQKVVVDPVTEYVSELATTVVAETEVPLNSRRGVVDLETDPGAVIVTTTGERVAETNLGDLAADALLWQGQQLAGAFGLDSPQIAFQNGGGIRSPDDLMFPTATPGSPADVTRLDVNNQFPFANFVSIMEDVPVDRLKAILEHAVSNVEGVDGRFLQVAGLTFEWDSTGTPEVDRVQAISVGATLVYDASAGGFQVPLTTTYDLASIDFTLNGGDAFDFGGLPFTRLGVTYEQGVLNYLADAIGGVITQAQYPHLEAGDTPTRIFQVG